MYISWIYYSCSSQTSSSVLLSPTVIPPPHPPISPAIMAPTRSHRSHHLGIQSIAPPQYLRPFGRSIPTARTFSSLFFIFCNCCTFSDYKNSRQCERQQLIVKFFTHLRFIQPDRVGSQQITPQKSIFSKYVTVPWSIPLVRTISWFSYGISAICWKK